MITGCWLNTVSGMHIATIFHREWSIPKECYMINDGKRSLELTTIYEISKILTSTINLGQSLNSVMNVLDKFLGMRYGTIVLQHKESNSLNTIISLGIDKERHIIFKSGEGIIGKVFKSGFPIVISNLKDEPTMWKGMNFDEDTIARFSMLCVPIKSPSRVKGILSVVFSKNENSISINDALSFLIMVGSLIGQAIEISNKIKEEKEKLREEKTHLQQALTSRHKIDNMVGQSEIMIQTFQTVKRVAASSATVLIRGESGTGKELVAKAIHYNSLRPDGPFIKLNCTAIPETLLESELFGHVKGSFTGAYEDKKGKFELGHNGTIFLDEIGDLPISTQLKLLRVLQEHSFDKLGSSKSTSVDVRIVAATNRDLEKGIEKGTFREDLYYRLNVVPINLPPLRSRRSDIPLLIDHFLRKYNDENSSKIRISEEAMGYLLNYDWPGNVREIENCIERIVILSENNIAKIDDLPSEIINANKFTFKFEQDSEEDDIEENNIRDKKDTPLAKSIEDIETERILEALKKCGWVKSRAAKLIGLTTRQLDYRITKYGIPFEKPW